MSFSINCPRSTLHYHCQGIGGGGGGGEEGSGSGGGGGGTIPCIIPGITLEVKVGGKNCGGNFPTGSCISAPGKTPSIPGAFNEDNTLNSTPGGGGGGGGGGVIGLATVAVATGLTVLECFLEESIDPEEDFCDEEWPCP